METVRDFILGGSKITADGEIKRRLLLGRQAMSNLGSILKSRDITLPTTVSHDLIKKRTSFLEEWSKNPVLKGQSSKEHDFITESYIMPKERGHHEWEPAETAVLNLWRF